MDFSSWLRPNYRDYTCLHANAAQCGYDTPKNPVSRAK